MSEAELSGFESFCGSEFWLASVYLAVIALADLIKSASGGQPQATTLSAALQCVAYLFTLILLQVEYKKGVVASGVLFFFWLFSLLCGIEPFYSKIVYYTETDPFFKATFYCHFAGILVSLVLNCVADNGPEDLVDGRRPCPETRSSFLARIAYWWMTPLLFTGYRKSLTESDLFALNPRDVCTKLVPKFLRVWAKVWADFRIRQSRKNALKVPVPVSYKVSEEERAPLLGGGGGGPPGPGGKKPPGRGGPGGATGPTPSLFTAIVKIFGARFLLSWSCKIVYDFVQFINPSLLKFVIEYVEDTSIPVWKGYIYAAAFFGSSIVSSFFFHQMFHIGMTSAMQIKAVVIAAIYRKALLLNAAGKKDTTVGEVVNLMSVDAQRLQDVAGYLWMVFSAPLQITIAIVLLWQELGASVLAGLAVMVLLIPVNGALASAQRKLQVAQMKNKDDRIKLLNEVFSGIKVLKLYAWELSFQRQVEQIRERELITLKKTAYLSAIGTFTWTCAPFLVTLATFAAYILSSSENVLTAGKAFTALSLFNILRVPLSLLPMIIAYLVTAMVSVNRISKFLSGEEIDPNLVLREPHRPGASRIEVSGADFCWEKGLPPTLRDISFSLPDGGLTAVVGSVGAGKSSLVAGVLGDMLKPRGSVTIRGRVALVSQQAWIQNATLRDNIQFTGSWDDHRYAKVLDCCALRPDLEILPGGDMTEIGEKGINLSGGQKQRVSLARAVYQDADIYILDDPLSAVDSHVGKHIFDQVIGPNGVLAGKTRLFVTNAIQWLPFVDNILVLSQGTVSEHGTYEQLMSRNGPFAQFLKQYITQEAEENEADEETGEIGEHEEPEVARLKEEVLSRVERLTSEDEDAISRRNSPTNTARSSSRRGGRRLSRRMSSRQQDVEQIKEEAKRKEREKLIQEERSATGNVKYQVFLAYFKAMNLRMTVSFFLFFILYQTASVFANVWLSIWTEDPYLNNASIPSNTSEYAALQNLYLGGYGAIGAAQAVFVLIYALLAAVAFVISSRKLHAKMLSNILRAPMSFFDTTPVGRIVNRFSRDIETIDNLLPQMFRSWISTFFNVMSTIVVISFSTPAFMSVIVPLGVLYVFVQRFFISTSRQLKRIESTTRSPIYTHFSETVTGTQTIRAYGASDEFVNESQRRVDYNQIFYFAGIAANRWLGFHLDFCGALSVLAATLFAVIGRGSVNGGTVGLSVSYALQVTAALNWMVRMSSDLETNIVSVERLEEYAKVQTEAEWDIPQTRPPPSWPPAGAVTFNDYAVRYRDGLDLVLRGITCDIRSGEKVGIVGRTGAGKSSLTLALFRIIEAARGRVTIDGEDISGLGLHQLRSRLTILPQDPVIFSGTLRMNLDPFDEKTDAELWSALELAHLKSFASALPEGLAYQCGEEGSNLSVGQRQLVCLARTLLRKSKILVLDEATAAVDLETDALIQQTIRKEFKDATEFDSPKALLQKPKSSFYSMARDANLV
uniref:ABC-type glutathione-S-conjugate transporter n=1 Tax=Macrostomum lignano TaxID=282301 RepID=A0A1I8HGU7_9PLAT